MHRWFSTKLLPKPMLFSCKWDLTNKFEQVVNRNIKIKCICKTSAINCIKPQHAISVHNSNMLYILECVGIWYILFSRLKMFHLISLSRDFYYCEKILNQNLHHWGKPEKLCSQNQISVPNWDDMIRYSVTVFDTYSLLCIVDGMHSFLNIGNWCTEYAHLSPHLIIECDVFVFRTKRMCCVANITGYDVRAVYDICQGNT